MHIRTNKKCSVCKLNGPEKIVKRERKERNRGREKQEREERREIGMETETEETEIHKDRQAEGGGVNQTTTSFKNKLPEPQDRGTKRQLEELPPHPYIPLPTLFGPRLI